MNTSSGLTNSKKNLLAPVLNALKAALGKHLIAVVLFGSRARGDADERSDWDLMLIASSLPRGVLKRHLALKRALPSQWHGRIALLAKTPEEFERRLPALFLDIAHDGIILYDPQGYADRKLHRIRQLRKEAGLERRERAGELIWDWIKPPTQTDLCQVSWAIPPTRPAD
jgi:predicted nucleotidyltransferase